MASAPTLPDDDELVRALRAGDEAVFMDLVRSWHPSMLRVALMYVPSRAVAEEVVQEAWLGVLTGIDRFEQRSSLKTWVYRILDQSRQDPRRARAAHDPVLGARHRRGRARRSGRRSVAVPGPQRRPPGRMGVTTRGVAAGAPAGRRDARRHRHGDQRPARSPAARHHTARRAGLRRRRGRRTARHLRRQPARPPAPRPQQGPRRPGGPPCLRSRPCPARSSSSS